MPTPERLARLVAQWQARARMAPPAAALPVRLGAHVVGLASAAVAAAVERRIARASVADGALQIDDRHLDADARSVLLADAAHALVEAGLVQGWRNEALDVRSTADGPALAVIERAACRALGITTVAVHMNAYGDAGLLAVARRAAHKSIDPGLWDTLVGGMVPAGETLDEALEREAWEEAGLAVDRLPVTRGRSFHVQRPVAEGWQSERVQVYDCILPADAVLANQDGEVAAIELRSISAVLDAIEADAFTLEAALVTLESLTRRGGHGADRTLFR